MQRYLKTILTSTALFCFLFYATQVYAEGTGAYHFGFKKSKNGSLPSIAQEGFIGILQKNEAIFLGNTDQKELYLTFDNGYENGYTAKILDVLKEKKTPATFFVTGHFVNDQPELVKRMVKEGHLVGNHSWSHPDLTTVGTDRIKQELDQVQEEVAKLTDQKQMKFVRPPRGIFSQRSLNVCRELGYTGVFWSVAYHDWDIKHQKGANFAYHSVVSQLHPGAVILLHSVSSDNASALRQIINEAKQRGFEFKSLEQLQLKTYR